jgi:hypothetical protein
MHNIEDNVQTARLVALPVLINTLQCTYEVRPLYLE